MNKLKMTFLMDPLERIDIHTDTTFVIMQEAEKRGHYITSLLPKDLYLNNGNVMGRLSEVRLKKGERWFCIGEEKDVDLKTMDIIFMREDPPFDMEYLYSTYLLEFINDEVFIINSPAGIRKANEKLYALNFSEIIPEYTVTRETERIKRFSRESGGRVVIKPLDRCGGSGVFAIFPGDKNTNVILETATDHGKKMVLAQRYIPEIREGDKRVILLDGEPIGVVNRVPNEYEHRGNIHVGATCEKARLTERDLYICNLISSRLKMDGLYFVGLDIIGGFLTEINVTSPTGIQEINRLEGLRLEERIVDFVEEMVS